MLVFTQHPTPDLTVRTYSDGVVSFEDGNGLTVILPPGPCPSCLGRPVARPNTAQSTLSNRSNLSLDSLTGSEADDERGFGDDDDDEDDFITSQFDGVSTSHFTHTESMLNHNDESTLTSYLNDDDDDDDWSMIDLYDSPQLTDEAVQEIEVSPSWYEGESLASAKQRRMQENGLDERQHARITWTCMYMASRRGVPGHEMYRVPDLSEQGVISRSKKSNVWW